MVEGKGYCARRQERASQKRLEKLLKNRDKIIVVPDEADTSPPQ